MPTKIELAWAAGLFEGEGSVSLMLKASGRPSIQLCLTTTDRDVIDRFALIVGAGKIYGPYIRPGNRKPQYSWRAHGWKLLRRLNEQWRGMLGGRRRAKFDKLLTAEPAPYVQINYKTRRLDRDQLLDVRRRLKRRERQRSIAKLYSVSQATISKIKVGGTYSEVR
jgi:hypothetical protein